MLTSAAKDPIARRATAKMAENILSYSFFLSWWVVGENKVGEKQKIELWLWALKLKEW